VPREASEELDALADVVGVVVEGLRDRVRDHDLRGAVHDGGDVGVLGDDTRDDCGVSDVPDEQRSPEGEPR